LRAVTTASSREGPQGTLARIFARARYEARRLRSSAAADARARSRLTREAVPGQLACEAQTVTETLYARLGPDDVAAAERRIRGEPGAWEHYFGTASRVENHGLLLALGVWFSCEPVIERTGLTRVEPPEEIHAMARGPLNGAGGLYEANMVIDALTGAGIEVSSLRAALDFGCSSGRVLRSLAAAFPDLDWHGCDPNAPAIEWAAANLPGIDFFVSPDTPPLRLGDASLDLVYAISIWSHFSPARGLDWFEEMRRVLRPGGCLVMTTHGFAAVAHYAETRRRGPDQLAEIERDLYRRGWWYAAEFGAAGDWGVVDPEWGTAFLSPEWLLAQLCPRWRVLEYAPGRNMENQDLYVLQRV
jgi:SAM-dependent methyltransferase